VSEISQLEERVSRLEHKIDTGFTELRDQLVPLLVKEEQVNTQQRQLDNLAADQRRLWDLVHAMQLVESARVGRGKVLTGIAHFLSAGMGAAVTWLATWLAGKGHP
jgi:hypothetical protein